jgi:hypothetical protein
VSVDGERSFRTYAGLSTVVAAVAMGLAVWLPGELGLGRGAVFGALLAVVTGAVALGFKRRALRRDMVAALMVMAWVFGMRAVGVVVGVVWVVRHGWDVVAFVAGFFGTYFMLQWIELSYVMAASRNAARGDE